EKPTPSKQWVDSMKPFTSVGSTHAISRVVFSKDGTRAVTSSEDRIVRHWDVEKGHVLDRLEPRTTPKGRGGNYVALSPDDRWLLTSDDANPILLFSYPSLEVGSNTYGGFQGHFSKDGDRLLTLERGILAVYQLDKPKRTF